MRLLDDTIVAIASPLGAGARGIVRASGVNVRDVTQSLFEADDSQSAPWSHNRPHAVAGKMTIPRWGRRVDVLLYVWPRGSYTGQPAVELHTIGSPSILDAILQAMCQNGARVARPGEFTLRAFLAGRLDLVQAEAVLGVIDSEDDQQLRTALRQMGGGISGRLADLRGHLLDLLADLEAGLDFVEEDIEFVSSEQIVVRLRAAYLEVRGIAEQWSQRRVDRSVPRVVFVGPPNAGKSSLINALLGEQRAIVSDCEGTTRDFLAFDLELLGTSCTLVDTAGQTAQWFDPQSPDAQAQDAARRQTADAHVLVLCLDRSHHCGPSTRQIVEQLLPHRPVIVWTKCDLPTSRSTIREWENLAGRTSATDVPGPSSIATSTVTLNGIEALKQSIVARLAEHDVFISDIVGTTAVRCSQSLQRAAEHLQAALAAASAGVGDEIVALELRSALEGLGEVVGTVYTDDVLDRIFSRFCIGK